MFSVVVIGSMSIHLVRFLKGLSDTGVEYFLITNQRLDFVAENKNKIVDFSLSNWHAVRDIKKILLKIHPKVVHIHQANSIAFHSIRAIKQLSVKPRIILTCWGSDVLLLPHRNLFFKYMVKFNLRSSDIITADAKYVLQKVQQLLPRSATPKLHLINFGIAIPIFDDNLIDNKEKIILSARLHKKLYQVDKIIEAFLSALQTGKLSKDYTLVVAASGEESESLKQMVYKSEFAGNVQFVGMLAYGDLVVYYKKAKVMISIPVSDATSSSLFEAMVYGCIPLVSNLPANLELIKDNESGVVNFDPQNLVPDLLRAISISADYDKYKKIYAQNFKAVSDYADEKANTLKFIELYTSRLSSTLSRNCNLV